METYYSIMQSPVGELLLVAQQDALIEIRFEKSKQGFDPDEDWVQKKTRYLSKVEKQLREYFKGKRTEFELTLAPEGTPFQQSVWDQLLRIPFGETISYGELARRVGKPKASRAVGAANGQNPISIVVPCHRVIGANGRLTGFGGGLPVKKKLLTLEGAPAVAARELFGAA